MRHAAPCQYDDSIGNASPLADFCTCPSRRETPDPLALAHAATMRLTDGLRRGVVSINDRDDDLWIYAQGEQPRARRHRSQGARRIFG